MMMDLAPSRRYSIAKALVGIPLDTELIIAILDWHAIETHPTVRNQLSALLGKEPEPMNNSVIDTVDA